jgi:peptidoglycan/xylan/chitin deacetylase (PgdA/CDA1 family)
VLSRLNKLALAFGGVTAGAIGAFGVSSLTVGIPTVLYLALCADGTVRPGSRVSYPTVTRGPRSRKRIALTFDDGPDPKVTPLVLDALAKHGARATFFAIGRWLAAHPDLARRIVADGHELGNHSWQHSRWANFLTSSQQMREMEGGEAAIAAVTGSDRPPLYRPPIGLKAPPLARAALRKQLTLVTWSLHSHDSRTDDSERISQRVLQRVRPGDIVLMHDGHDLPGRHRLAGAEALPAILDGLREKGLESVTVSELLRGEP